MRIKMKISNWHYDTSGSAGFSIGIAAFEGGFVTLKDPQKKLHDYYFGAGGVGRSTMKLPNKLSEPLRKVSEPIIKAFLKKNPQVLKHLNQAKRGTANARNKTSEINNKVNKMLEKIPVIGKRSVGASYAPSTFDSWEILVIDLVNSGGAELASSDFNGAFFLYEAGVGLGLGHSAGVFVLGIDPVLLALVVASEFRKFPMVSQQYLIMETWKSAKCILLTWGTNISVGGSLAVYVGSFTQKGFNLKQAALSRARPSIIKLKNAGRILLKYTTGDTEIRGRASGHASGQSAGQAVGSRIYTGTQATSSRNQHSRAHKNVTHKKRPAGVRHKCDPDWKEVPGMPGVYYHHDSYTDSPTCS